METPKGRRDEGLSLVKHKPLIVIHFVQLQHRQQLFHEIPSSVMFFLMGDIPFNIRYS